MVCSIKKMTLVAFISFLLVGSFVAGNALAEETAAANPLRFYNGSNNSYMEGFIKTEAAFFTQNNSWFGESRANLGKSSTHWWESAITAGFQGSYFFESIGEMYGKFDAVQGNTGNGTDAAGSNAGLGNVSDLLRNTPISAGAQATCSARWAKTFWISPSVGSSTRPAMDFFSMMSRATAATEEPSGSGHATLPIMPQSYA